MVPVYPRWRGEHKYNDILTLYEDGLSPLARGTPAEVAQRLNSSRFIPAGAGNTWESTTNSNFNPVYPRWRGEHSKSIYLFYKAF